MLFFVEFLGGDNSPVQKKLEKVAAALENAVCLALSRTDSSAGLLFSLFPMVDKGSGNSSGPITKKQVELFGSCRALLTKLRHSV